MFSTSNKETKNETAKWGNQYQWIGFHVAIASKFDPSAMPNKKKKKGIQQLRLSKIIVDLTWNRGYWEVVKTNTRRRKKGQRKLICSRTMIFFFFWYGCYISSHFILFQGMGLWQLIMRMEAGTAVGEILEVGVVGEDVVSVVVEGEGTIDLRLICSNMVDTIEMHLLKAAASFFTYLFNTLGVSWDRCL